MAQFELLGWGLTREEKTPLKSEVFVCLITGVYLLHVQAFKLWLVCTTGSTIWIRQHNMISAASFCMEILKNSPFNNEDAGLQCLNEGSDVPVWGSSGGWRRHSKAQTNSMWSHKALRRLDSSFIQNTSWRNTTEMQHIMDLPSAFGCGEMSPW